MTNFTCWCCAAECTSDAHLPLSNYCSSCLPLQCGCLCICMCACDERVSEADAESPPSPPLSPPAQPLGGGLHSLAVCPAVMARSGQAPPLVLREALRQWRRAAARAQPGLAPPRRPARPLRLRQPARPIVGVRSALVMLLGSLTCIDATKLMRAPRAVATPTLRAIAPAAPRTARDPAATATIATITALATVAVVSLTRAPRKPPAVKGGVSATQRLTGAPTALAAPVPRYFDVASDGSKFDLRPDNPSELAGLVAAAETLIDEGVNDNTSKGEHSAWYKYYMPFCKRMKTAPWREFEYRRRPLHEASFLGAFALYTWRQMKPRRATDKAPRVESLRSVIAHIRRKHARRGHELAPNTTIAHLLRGMARKRIREYGITLPVRAEPFTASENVAMKRVPPTTKVAGTARTARFWAGWRLVDTYGDQAGPRKAEIVGEEDVCYMRSDVQLVISGVAVADPTPQHLRNMVSKRDYVTVKVNVSKADFDGSTFGPSLVTLLYNRDNPMSFACAFVDYELAYPCSGTERLTRRLFTTDGSAPWTGALIDSTLRAVMQATLTAEQSKGKTFHSKRVWVACALGNLRSSDAEIQAFVRWSSADSLRLYRRIGHSYQAKRRDLMATADVSLHNATARPEIGGGDGAFAFGGEQGDVATALDDD